MKIEVNGFVLAQKAIQAIKGSAFFRWLFPAQQLVPVPIARRTVEVRRRR
jgi:hypothetical protein